ncbi:uncharacterized protein LOC112904650 [Agrilus planipennis]|uniref:Uncharacterized protein LOC112904650 n=1 Tax=Agrilus planipennis TaxID=224129 RepID=A0A7F5R5P1_AGRPL|nr:uncharacterized protein LOC112904650 [Agrilus planipennis]
MENLGNIKIPLPNGHYMKIPLSSINISEEVNKTAIWKQLNDARPDEKSKKKSPNPVSRFKKKKLIIKKEEKKEEKGKLEKRLSTMNEEDEDEGITIKRTSLKETGIYK